MSALFTPPATDRCPSDYVPSDPSGDDPWFPSPWPIRKLMQRYQGNLRAPNVFKLVAGGYTTTQPWEQEPGTVIAYTYYGSHTYEVSDDEAAALTAAGFGSGITP